MNISYLDKVFLFGERSMLFMQIKLNATKRDTILLVKIKHGGHTPYKESAA